MKRTLWIAGSLVVPLLASMSCADILDIPTDRHVVADASWTDSSTQLDANTTETSEAGQDVSTESQDDAANDHPTGCQGTIGVRLTADLAGPTKVVSTPLFYGHYDYLREINEAGGIRGCLLDIEWEEVASDAAKILSAYSKWRSEASWPTVAAVLTGSTPETQGITDEVMKNSDRIVVISGSYLSALASPSPVNRGVEVPSVSDQTWEETSFNEAKSGAGYPYNFFPGTDYSTGARTAMYHVSQLGGKRVGFFHCTSAYCLGPLAAAKTYARGKVGLDIGRDLIIEQTDDAATIEGKVIKYFQDEKAHQAQSDSGYQMVDWVWMGNTTGTTAAAAKALAKVRAQLGIDVQMIVNNWGFDEMLPGLCGTGDAGPGLCEGFVHGIMPILPYGDTQSSEMANVIAVHDKWRAKDAQESGSPPASYENVRYVTGYLNVMLLKLAIETAIDHGKATTGDEIKAALETFSHKSVGGLTSSISFSPTDHRPQSTESIYKIGLGGVLVNEPPPRTIFLEADWLGW